MAKRTVNPCQGCIYEYEPCGGCGEKDDYKETKNTCKSALRTALSSELLFPGLFPDGVLTNAIIKEYGQEFVADCLAEMR